MAGRKKNSIVVVLDEESIRRYKILKSNGNAPERGFIRVVDEMFEEFLIQLKGGNHAR